MPTAVVACGGNSVGFVLLGEQQVHLRGHGFLLMLGVLGLTLGVLGRGASGHVWGGGEDAARIELRLDPSFVISVVVSR
jgi:hypothetical protein